MRSGDAQATEASKKSQADLEWRCCGFHRIQVNSMLATLTIWLSAAVAVLVLVEIFLSKAQKEWLSNAVLKIWSSLDEAKGWSFADWLIKPGPKWWEGLALVVFALLASYSIFLVSYSMYHILVNGFEREFNFHFYQALQLWFGALLIVTSTSSIFVRGTVEFDSTHVRILAILSVFGAFVGLIGPGFSHYISASTFSLSEWDVLFAIGILVGYPAVIVLPIWAALGLTYIASAILYVCEFIIRRIAEYPKGPVLALSALFGGIAALIKAFG
jgi:hypothetical protein